MSTRTEAAEYFWDMVEPLFAEDGIEEGSLMGFPCLRLDGAFFATCDHRTGDLIVKLPADRVGELIDSGAGTPFSPAGKVFKEWVLVDNRDAALWLGLLDEAKAFARA
ncbi:MAG: hypothetical protein ACR2PK_00010 [Acidimicrobiales bacterium]